MAALRILPGLLTLLLALHHVAAQAPLVSVPIPLRISSDRRYLANVNMSSDPDTQRFRFALAANTGFTSVAGSSCSNCNNVPSYNQSLSSSAQPLTGSRNITIGTASISGNFIRENCGLQQQNGSSWQYPNQTIIVADSSTAFSGDTSGIIGLGTNGNGATGNFSDTIFGGWLSRNPTRNNFSFGMALTAPDSGGEDGGIIDWVVPKMASVSGQVTTRNTLASAGIASDNTSFSLPDSDWTIQMDGWGLNVGSSTVSNFTSTVAMLEPYFPSMYFPATQARQLYSVVPGAQQQAQLSGGAQVWNIPCNTQISLGFKFDQNFVLDQSNFVVKNGDGTCSGAVQGWADDSINYFLLGGKFFSAFYLIFTVGKPGSDVPNSIGIGFRAVPNKSSNVGAIVGGVVGGIAIIALIGLGIFFFMRRRSRSRRAPSSIAKEEQAAAAMGREKYHDEDGSQYAQYPRPISESYASTRNGLPTPPHSAFSATSQQGLLPEPQSPQSPFLSVPGSPINAYMTTASSRGGYANSSQGGGTNSDAGHTIYTTADGQNVHINPYVLPPASPSSSMGFSRDVKSQQWRQSQQGQSQRDSVNLINLDPLASSTGDPSGQSTSGEGTSNHPALPPPPPPGAMRNSKIAAAMASGDVSRWPGRREQTPAPPYSNSEGQAVSPTLVEFSPTTDAQRNSQAFSS